MNADGHGLDHVPTEAFLRAAIHLLPEPSADDGLTVRLPGLTMSITRMGY